MAALVKKGPNADLAVPMARPENKVCADCGAKAPGWAVVNLGIFVCIDCSGIHRKLGVHISSVKSPTLDTWKPEWVEMVTKVGNRSANAYYESSLPPNYPRPGQPGGHAEGVEDWIRRKYERKDFAPRSKGLARPAPCELALEGKNPDVYSGDDVAGDSKLSSTPAKTTADAALNLADMPSPEPSAEQLEDAEVLNTLTEYYNRINEAKTRDQLMLIVTKFKGRREVLFAELEKKYGQPVVPPKAPEPAQISSDWAAFSASPNDDGATQSFPSNAGLAQHATTQAFPAHAGQALDVPFPQQPQAQPLDCLKQNLSVLYEQQQAVNGPSIAPGANGSNFDALRFMQGPGGQPAQGGAAMQNMNGMNGMYQMNAMQQMGYMQQMQQQGQQHMMMQMQQSMVPAVGMQQAYYTGPQF